MADIPQLQDDMIKPHSIPEEIRKSSQEILFDYVAERVKSFIEEKKITERTRLGFTFSFPVNYESISSGKLLRWSKDFSASGAVGKDPVMLLKEAFERKNVSIIYT